MTGVKYDVWRETIQIVSDNGKEKYQSERIWTIWNTFTSNLSGAQRSMFILLYFTLKFQVAISLIGT